MKKNNFKERSIYFWGAVALIIIISLWFINLFVLKGLDHNSRGTFGDMFGSINALFSGLALAGVIFTILLQSKELSLQRGELKETRKEFTINRITNIIYRQGEMVEARLKDLLLQPEFKSGMIVDGYNNKLAYQALQEMAIRIDRSIDNKETTFMETSFLYSFLKNSDTKEYIIAYIQSVTLCNNLIHQTDNQGKKMLDENERYALHFLMSSNFAFHNNRPFFQSYIKYLNWVIEQDDSEQVDTTLIDKTIDSYNEVLRIMSLY